MKALPASLVVQVRVPGKNLNPSNKKLNAGHSCPSQSNINIYLHSLWAFIHDHRMRLSLSRINRGELATSTSSLLFLPPSFPSVPLPAVL
jgi:hypothetical protein